jgi:hypothetical protein
MKGNYEFGEETLLDRGQKAVGFGCGPGTSVRTGNHIAADASTIAVGRVK